MDSLFETIQEEENFKSRGIIPRPDLTHSKEYHPFKLYDGHNESSVALFIKDGLNLKDIDIEVLGNVVKKDHTQKLDIYIEGTPAKVKVDLSNSLYKEGSDKLSFYIDGEFNLSGNILDTKIESTSDSFYFHDFVFCDNHNTKLKVKEEGVDNFYAVNNSNVTLEAFSPSHNLVYNNINAPQRIENVRQDFVVSNENLDIKKSVKANTIEARDIKLDSALAKDGVQGTYKIAFFGDTFKIDSANIKIEAVDRVCGISNVKTNGETYINKQASLKINEPVIFDVQRFETIGEYCSIDAISSRKKGESLFVAGKAVQLDQNATLKLGNSKVFFDQNGQMVTIKDSVNLEGSVVEIPNKNIVELEKIDLYNCVFIKTSNNIIEFKLFELKNISATNGSFIDCNLNPNNSFSLVYDTPRHLINRNLATFSNCDFSAKDTIIQLRDTLTDDREVAHKDVLTMSNTLFEGENIFLNVSARAKTNMTDSALKSATISIGELDSDSNNNKSYDFSNTVVEGNLQVRTLGAKIRQTELKGETLIASKKIEMSDCYTKDVKVIGYEKIEKLGLFNKTYKSNGEYELKMAHDFATLEEQAIGE